MNELIRDLLIAAILTFLFAFALSWLVLGDIFVALFISWITFCIGNLSWLSVGPKGGLGEAFPPSTITSTT